MPNVNVRAFAPKDLANALEFVGRKSTEVPALESMIQRLERKLNEEATS